MNNLCEILVVLAIVSILLVMAVPSGREFLLENRAAASVNSVVNGLNLARSEAIQRNEKIIFCKSLNHIDCGGNWNDGQIIVNASNKLLKVFSALPAETRLVWNSSAGKDDYVEWLPTGYTNGQRGSFYYCAGSDNPAYSRVVVVLNTGRIYVTAMSKEDFELVCV